MGVSPELEKQIKEFDENQNFKNSKPERVKKAEQEREKFVNRFPIDKIRDIKIDNYVPGRDPTNRDTFAYLNEFGSPNFGNNKGGGALKFGVWIVKNGERKGEYTWAGEVIGKDDENRSGFDTKEEAYRNTINTIADCVEAAAECTKSNDWEKLARIFNEKVELKKYTPWPLVICKAVAMYFPKDFPYSWSHEHLNFVLDIFGINHEDMKKYDRDFYKKLQRLVNFKNKHPIIKNWTNRYLTEFTRPDWLAKKEEDRQARKEAELQKNDSSLSEKSSGDNAEDDEVKKDYWSFQCGTEDRRKTVWQRWIQGNTVSVGWNKVDDYTQYKSRKAMKEAFKKAKYRNKDKRGGEFVAGDAAFDMCRIEPGDILFINDGKQGLFGIVRATGKYKHDTGRTNYCNEKECKCSCQWHHVLPVEWIRKDYVKFDSNNRPTANFNKTISKITSENRSKWEKFLNPEETMKQEQRVPINYKIGKFNKQDFRKYEEKGYNKLLQNERQIIFYGPPGTGKTYTAKEFVNCRPSKWVMVVFHPSYSYEDFVEGFRPVVPDDKEELNQGISYKLEKGIFWNICKDAEDDPKTDYFLIIDEINRGNISKIFGELISLIESDKRGKDSVRLAYSKNEFSVPKNLFIIGTMNTADMSLVQVDTALRRRFGFIELMPVLDQVKNSTYRKILKNLNEKIREEKNMRDRQVGHSYFMFMKSDADLQFDFKYKIIPLLQDYFYYDYQKLAGILGKQIINEKEQKPNDDYLDKNPDRFVKALEEHLNKK